MACAWAAVSARDEVAFAAIAGAFGVMTVFQAAVLAPIALGRDSWWRQLPKAAEVLTVFWCGLSGLFLVLGTVGLLRTHGFHPVWTHPSADVISNEAGSTTLRIVNHHDMAVHLQDLTFVAGLVLVQLLSVLVLVRTR